MSLFRRDKHRATTPTTVGPPADSGYATSANPSSEATATTSTSGTDSDLSNRSRPANLQVEQPTGKVMDRDTGNTVVTVTTTTTTKTTTTTNRDGKIEVKTEPVNLEVQHRYDELQKTPGRDSNLSSFTDNSSRAGNATDSGNPRRTSNYADTTTNNTNRNATDTSGSQREPNPTSAAIDPSHESANLATSDPDTAGNNRQDGSPPSPAESAMRESSRGRVNNEDVPTSATGFSSPTSPAKHNFSYPQRAPPDSINSYQAAKEKIPVENDPARTTNQPVGALANLKTAAAGLHGVGETLRGTLNSTMDRKFGHASPETLAKNEQTLAAGRAEIESGKFRDSVKEREKAHTVGKGLRQPINQHGQEETGNLRVVNQDDPPVREEAVVNGDEKRKRRFF